MPDISQENILFEAEKIYVSNNNIVLLEYLLQFKHKYQILESEENKKFNHLLAIAYLLQKKYSEAEEHCKDCLTVEPNQIDYYFVLTSLHVALREYSKALHYSDLFLETFNTNTSEHSYTNTNNHKCQIYNFTGCAYMELGNTEEAKKHFLLAIKADKVNQIPYINLVNLCIKNKEFENAHICILHGLKDCIQTQELRLLEKSIYSTEAI